MNVTEIFTKVKVHTFLHNLTSLCWLLEKNACWLQDGLGIGWIMVQKATCYSTTMLLLCLHIIPHTHTVNQTSGT